MRKISKVILIWTVAFLFIVLTVVINYPYRYKKTIKKYAEAYNVERSLVYAVIYCESSFNKKAVSSAGAKGLMQLMPSTANFVADMLGEDDYDLFNPSDNIRFGVKYLSYLFEKFKNEQHVLYAYNAGEGVVKKWLSSGGDFPYKESVNYYKRVIKVKKIYKKLYF
ncbi:MAG TPA: lytic transglycosylase [Clostridiales bacterium]|nr:lytic transglycosylase [Clostridiales bacterium]